VNTDLGFLVSLVELEILGNSEMKKLGDSAMLEACFKVAAYAVPLPAETDRSGPPGTFMQLAFQVAREAFNAVRAQSGGEHASPIAESIVASVHLIGYEVKEGMDLGTPPNKMPRSARCIGEAEWSWSPHHERWARWYVSKNSARNAWVLWEITPNWREWGLDQPDCPSAMVASKGIDRHMAAMHLLVATLRREASDENLECFHSITPRGILSFDDFDAISDAVWNSEQDEVAELLIDKNRMTNLIIEAWRARVDSLSSQ
jgi:hypothetical protein